MSSPHPHSPHCPACERYIGPAESCPWCGVDGLKPISLKVFRRLSLFLAPLGIALLATMVNNQELPLLAIRDLTPMMNYGHVRVQGIVTREPTVRRYNKQVDYLSYTLDDGTGHIRVTAYRDAARELANNQLIPEQGRAMEIGGTLTVNNYTHRSLTITSAEHVKPLY